jgi:hypothetical protein
MAPMAEPDRVSLVAQIPASELEKLPPESQRV